VLTACRADRAAAAATSGSSDHTAVRTRRTKEGITRRRQTRVTRGADADNEIAPGTRLCRPAQLDLLRTRGKAAAVDHPEKTAAS